MRFASLGSGSRGNATVVSCADTTVLIDCGFSMRETEGRLRRAGVEPTELSAIVVTHEHQDHSQGVGALARRYGLPVYMTAGTHRAGPWGNLPELMFIEPQVPFVIDDLELDPFTVPHDAGEPVQFVFSDGERRLGLLTDTGMITPHIVKSLHGLSALLLECNHDTGLLSQSDYPDTLKQRVGGNYGHLNNDQAAQLLAQIDRRELHTVVAMHLSQQNNRPALARSALATGLGDDRMDIWIADQTTGLDWLTL